MLEKMIQTREHVFNEEIINSQYYGCNSLEELTNNTPNNNILPLPLTTTGTSPENQIATAFPSCDQFFPTADSPTSFDEYISCLLNPPSPPDWDFASYPANPPSNPTISSADFKTCNGDFAREFYDDFAGVATGDMVFFAGEEIGMPVMLPESDPNCGFGNYGQISRDDQHLMSGRCIGGAAPMEVPSNNASLDGSKYKVGRVSVEERKEQIGRYLKKRNERNFSKKIKYTCRKTLADKRPRVRGRFAKNEDLGKAMRRTNLDNYEYNDMLMKNKEKMLQTSDMQVHIKDMNPFNYNYTLESWM